MKIYTKSGDLGETGLLNSRVKKSDFRIEIIGQLDELLANLALLIIDMNDQEIKKNIKRIYKDLFLIQSYIADAEHKYQFNIEEDEVSFLEKQIDLMTSDLPVLNNFIYCTGHKNAVTSHLVRTKIRTVERLLVTLHENSSVDSTILKYINRLSDYFFTLARYINKIENIAEEVIRL